MTNPVVLISKKRDGKHLTDDQIHEFIAGYASGTIPDYQMSAMAMAICCRGMSSAETAALTDAMLQSGQELSWPAGPPRVDKHSTGGLGDKVSIVLAPLLACCGVQIPMISGRGLGATGGTLDKLESISGFRTDLTVEEIRAQVEKVGCVITSATKDLAPADRKLYALRDVSGTVPSIPLITASIMSKKLAAGLDALVLDVKFGSGAFMKTYEEARELAKSLVETGHRMGVATSAILTDMNQPLGRMVGNAVEIDESVDALKGQGPDDLMQVTLALGAELLVLARVASSVEAGEKMLKDAVDDGRGLEKLREMVAAQGGNLDAPRERADAYELTAESNGIITTIDAEQLGHAVIDLGGGRKKVGDSIDFAVGIEMKVRIGDRIERGQPLMNVFARKRLKHVDQLLQHAVHVEESSGLPLIRERIA